MHHVIIRKIKYSRRHKQAYNLLGVPGLAVFCTMSSREMSWCDRCWCGAPCRAVSSNGIASKLRWRASTAKSSALIHTLIMIMMMMTMTPLWPPPGQSTGGSRTFNVSAPLMWDALSEAYVSAPSLSTFR